MKLKINLQLFRKTFFHPRVFVFILTGTAIIFLTFFTSNNAIEIAVSGIASVFIGIGVNNFSSLETHQKDEEKIKSKIGHSLNVMEITKSRINRLHKQASKESCNKMKDELAELEQFINLGIELIKENNSLN